MIKLDRQSIVQLLLIGVFFAAGTYALYAFGIVDLFMDKHRLQKFIHEHRTYAVSLFIGLQALQVVAAPIPGEVTGIAGGILFGPFWGFVYSTIGLTIGSWLAFLIARFLGRHLVEMLVSAELIKKYDYVMKHKGMFLAFLMFLIPGFPKDFLCYLLGLGHMGQPAFLAVSTSGRLFGTALLTLGGTYFRDARYGAFFTVVVIGVALVVVVMIYRENIEGGFRKMRLTHHRRTRKERDDARKKCGPGSEP